MLRLRKALAVLLMAAPAAAGSLSISCEPGPSGLRSLVVESAAAALSVRQTGEAVVIEAADPGDDLAGGSLRCDPARSVRIVPGRLTGTAVTRVLVTLGREAPRVVETGGRVRLLWVPGKPAEPVSAASREPEPPRAPADEPPARGRKPEPRRSAPRAEPEAPAPAETPRAAEAAPPPSRRPPPELPDAAEPAAAPPAGTNALPSDFLPLEKPAPMVALMATEARRGPGRRYPAAGAVPAGGRITADGRAGDWLRCSDATWVFGPYFEAPEEALAGDAFLARVDAISAPVHGGPAPSFEIVAEIYRGEQVVIDEVKNEWAHVRDGGWVKLSELTRVERGSGKD